MSISSIPASGGALHAGGAKSIATQAGQDVKHLANALQSGDLTGAKNDFSALMQLLQDVAASSLNKTSSDGTQSKAGTDLAAIGNALQSGSLSSARDAFDKLLQDMQLAEVAPLV